MTTRVLNWNVERATPQEARFTAISDSIESLGADLVVLTETHRDLRHADLPGFACSAAPDDRDGAPGECWVSIQSRRGLEDLTPQLHDPQRCAAALLELDGDTPLLVFGCVLPWLGSTWRGMSTRGGEAFSSAARLYFSDLAALRVAHPDAATILAGDLNQDLSRRHYYGSSIQRGLLESSLVDAGLTALTSGDADPVRRVSETHACIDHICVSQAITEGAECFAWPDAEAPPRKLSDHYAIVADLKL